MEKESPVYSYKPLVTPTPLKEQTWPGGTVPFVAVKVITYNHEQFLTACLEGALMQETTFPVKIFIHDDASTDQTIAILRTYEQRYPHLIQVYYQPENTYASKDKFKKRAPFNNLIQGKYIALCEGDDYWTDPLKLEKQVGFLERNPDFSFSFHQVDLLTNGIITPEIMPHAPEIVDTKEVILIKSEFAKTQIRTCSVLFRNTFNQPPEWTQKSMHQDFVLFLHLATLGKGYYIKESMAVYRIHPQGVFSSIVLTEDKNRITQVYLNHIKMYRHFNKQLNYQYNEDVIKVIISRFYSLIELRYSLSFYLKFILGQITQLDIKNLKGEIKLLYSFIIGVLYNQKTPHNSLS